MERKINVIIADDHPIFRTGLKQIIDSPFIKVAGEAANGEEALKLIMELKPHAAILDINMPLLDGIGVLAEVKKQKLDVKVVFLTFHKNENIFNQAMDMGANGFVLKENASSDLIDCINTVIKGEYYISPIISGMLMNRLKRNRDFEETNDGLKSLTDVERKILKMITEAKSSKEIADELYVSPRTIEKHREHISHKLGLHGNNALLKFALDNKSSL